MEKLTIEMRIKEITKSQLEWRIFNEIDTENFRAYIIDENVIISYYQRAELIGMLMIELQLKRCKIDEVFYDKKSTMILFEIEESKDGKRRTKIKA